MSAAAVTAGASGSARRRFVGARVGLGTLRIPGAQVRVLRFPSPAGRDRGVSVTARRRASAAPIVDARLVRFPAWRDPPPAAFGGAAGLRAEIGAGGFRCTPFCGDPARGLVVLRK